MVEVIFGFLEKVGFTHPVHPAILHVPMGMVMGAVTFRIASFIPRLKMLAKTGYHCIILGILGAFPTIFTGYLDWQHSFSGEWLPLIIVKMVLAGLFLVLLCAIAIMDKPDQPKPDKVTIMYLVALLVAIGLGFSGGELIYG